MPVLVGVDKVDVEVAMNYPAADRVQKINVGTPEEREVLVKGGYLQFIVKDIYKSQAREEAGMLRVETTEGVISFPLYNMLYWTPSKRKEEVSE